MPLNDVLRQTMQPFTAALTSNRVLLYSVFSTVAVTITVVNACRNYSNFYAVVIYLSRSSRSLMVLANFGFLSALLSGRILQRVFFGPLQPREVERLYDQTWMFVTESLLAFTIFRDEFDIPFVMMFGFLLFVKCFHWLMADRVESMDQMTYPGPPTLFHIRMNSLFILLWLTDVIMFAFAVESTLSNGVGGMVLFASEYAILMASALNAMARYTLSLIDVRRARSRGGENAPPWEHKSMYIFYIELASDFLKLTTYLTFFMIILTFYGLPLNIIRDVYLTARSFITRLRALIRYRNATRDMDRRYPDATEAELSEISDRTCIICREEMILQNPPPAEDVRPNPTPQAPTDGPNVTPKKLPCGHIFHFQCLRSWLERQQSCPTCRRPVLETNPPNQPAGPPRQGVVREPAPPQPGQAPQRPPAGQQGGGAVGWLGRVLGFPAQRPLNPAQFAHGDFRHFAVPAPAPQQNPGNPGWAPIQQIPPGFFYANQFAVHPQQPLPAHLQPPPIYHGFHGPGGVWHPWGVDPQPAPDQRLPVQAQPPQPGVELSGASTTAPTPTVPAGSSSPTPSAGTDPSASVEPGNEERTAPGAAAALAAMRRLNALQPSLNLDARAPTTTSATTSDRRLTDRSQPSSSAHGTQVTSSSRSSIEHDSTTATNIPAPPVSDTASNTTVTSSLARPDLTPHPPSSGTDSSSGATPTAQRHDEDRHINLPPLIPLHEFVGGTPRIPNALPNTPLFAGMPPQGYYPQYFRPAQGPRGQALPSSGNPRAQPNPLVTASDQNHRYQQRGPRAQLNALPPTLTDEQLARLDRVTRDAIDERLRVLEGVSGAVYRCIEELTRIRSVLPLPAVGAGQGQRQDGPASGSLLTPVPTNVAQPSPEQSADTTATVSAAPTSYLEPQVNNSMEMAAEDQTEVSAVTPENAEPSEAQNVQD